MSFIQDIQRQSSVVRHTLFVFSVVTTVSIVGFFWFTSVQREMYFALHDDPQDRQAFLDQHDQSLPQPLAVVSRGLGTLTASIGSLLGIDKDKGLDRSERDTVHLLPLSP